MPVPSTTVSTSSKSGSSSVKPTRRRPRSPVTLFGDGGARFDVGPVKPPKPLVKLEDIKKDRAKKAQCSQSILSETSSEGSKTSSNRRRGWSISVLTQRKSSSSIKNGNTPKFVMVDPPSKMRTLQVAGPSSPSSSSVGNHPRYPSTSSLNTTSSTSHAVRKHPPPLPQLSGPRQGRIIQEQPSFVHGYPRLSPSSEFIIEEVERESHSNAPLRSPTSWRQPLRHRASYTPSYTLSDDGSDEIEFSHENPSLTFSNYSGLDEDELVGVDGGRRAMIQEQRTYGWRGEWNQEDVISKLRQLKS